MQGVCKTADFEAGAGEETFEAGEIYWSGEQVVQIK